MKVTEVCSLPEKFRPSFGGAPSTEDVPAPIAELIRKGTSGLTGPERRAFLLRLKKKHPGLFSERTGEEKRQFSEDLAEEKWRETLVRLLKEEANRFMAAAASL